LKLVRKRIEVRKSSAVQSTGDYEQIIVNKGCSASEPGSSPAKRYSSNAGRSLKDGTSRMQVAVSAKDQNLNFQRYPLQNEKT